jgi:hypothetical protein
VAEHQTLHARRQGNAANVLGGDLMGNDRVGQGQAIVNAGSQALNGNYMHQLIDQYVGTLGELGQRREVIEIAGQHDAFVGDLEAEGEGLAIGERRVRYA